MFKIVKNNIPDVFECFYEDEYRNRAHLKREDHGFYMRICPNNKAVEFPLIRVEFPISPDDKGISFKLKFYDGTDHTADPDIQAAIQGAAELVNRWICMVTDVSTLDFNPKYMHINDTEAYARLKLDSITKYEELNQVKSAVK